MTPINTVHLAILKIAYNANEDVKVLWKREIYELKQQPQTLERDNAIKAKECDVEDITDCLNLLMARINRLSKQS